MKKGLIGFISVLTLVLLVYLDTNEARVILMFAAVCTVMGIIILMPNAIQMAAKHRRQARKLMAEWPEEDQKGRYMGS